MTSDFLDTVRQQVVVFDGGMGATLEQFELTQEDYGGLQGKCHEALVLNRPDVIEGVHSSMVEAGAIVVETDTFQASRLKLDEWGLGEHTLEINTKAAEIARKAVGEDRFVAGSIGPTGYLPASDDPTLGQIRFGELVEVFTQQATGLIQGGADLIIIETAQDILEVKAAVFGTREAFKQTGKRLPIQCSVSLLPNGGKMLLGTDIQAVLAILTGLEVDVVGLNCSTGPEDMRDAIRYLGEHSPLPIHCIPNAGIPHQGPEGETIFPEQPEPLANVLQEFVERFGVGIVGGCCGTTPEHIAAIVERVGGREPRARPEPASPLLASMMTAAPLVQEPRPTLVGERVNSQGSRKAKELLLADDYDGLVAVAEDQVEGGAHVLDLCVALTERQDEDEQMRQVAKRVSLTQPAPIQIDSTEPDVIRTALEQIPGRAIVNSVNLEAGRDKLDVVAPLAKEHGAALIALTIDEVGMAKTADRKVEIAQRITEMVCDEHGLDRELLIFDVLTFTLTTGDDEWKPSAVETIEGIRRVKAEIPGVKTSLGVSNVSFGVSPGARAVLNSVFLHHCVEAGLDLAMVNPNHITPYPEIPENERELADDLVFNRREDALERFIGHFEEKGEEEDDGRRRPDRRHGARGGAPLAHPAAQEGRRRGLDRQVGREDRRRPDAERGAPPRDEGGGRQVRRRRADPAVRAPVGRGDEARRRPARELPRADRGPHEGQGRDRDRVRRRARHRQVARQHDPHEQRLHGRGPRQAGPGGHDHLGGAGARGHRDRAVRAARLHLEADAAVRPGAAPARARVPGARGRRGDQPRLRPPASSTRTGRSPTTSTSRASSTARTPSRGSTRWTSSSSRTRARRSWRRCASEAQKLREKPEVSTTRRRSPTTRCARPRARTRRSPSRRSGACARSTSTSTRSTRTSTGTCCSSSTGAAAARRARSGRSCSRATARTRASCRSSSACGASRTTSSRARRSATSRATRTGTSW